MAAFLRVNGEAVPSELIEAEKVRLSALDGWETIQDPAERETILREAAEKSAVDRILLRQQVAKDTAPLSNELVEKEIARFNAENGCRSTMAENVRGVVEAALRQDRAMRKLAGPQPRLNQLDVRAFFEANSSQFLRPEQVNAAHIIKHVNQAQSEADVLPAMNEALDELNAGTPFSAVADRYSDCKGEGSELGWFARGVMVEEFERIVFSLPPGGRSQIFRTPFGFHIAEVRDKRPAGAAAFEDVADEAERTLRSLLERRAIEQAFDKLRSGARMERIVVAQG